jgi:hypothetical protein
MQPEMSTPVRDEAPPDIELAQRLEHEMGLAAEAATHHETHATAFRRKQQMCEAALSQIKAQDPQTQAAYADAVNVR